VRQLLRQKEERTKNRAIEQQMIDQKCVKTTKQQKVKLRSIDSTIDNTDNRSNGTKIVINRIPSFETFD
jgi:hypothetical protein